MESIYKCKRQQRKRLKKKKTKKYIGKNKKIEKHTEMSSNIFGKNGYTRECWWFYLKHS